MRTLADIWLIWTVAAVTLVAAKCLQTRWYARQLEKRELEEERRVRRAYQRIYEDLNRAPVSRCRARLHPSSHGLPDTRGHSVARASQLRG
jgi:hypothetical protein